MAHKVNLEKVYYHPRTGKRLSLEAAKKYNKRAKKKIKPIEYLVVRHAVGNTKGLSRDQIAILKKKAGRIVYAGRLTQTEKILKLTSLADRHVRRTLANHRVFRTLWEDFHVKGDIQRRGSIRISLGGTAGDRRIKEIIHLGFHRQSWLEKYSSDQKAFEGFKDWLVGTILSNLRRRGLRLSNPKESKQRIEDLRRNRDGMVSMMEMEQDPAKIGKWVQRIKWANKAVNDQKKSKQLTRVSMKIDKLV